MVVYPITAFVAVRIPWAIIYLTTGDLAGNDLSKGHVEVPGTVHGAVVGVNHGTIQITSSSNAATAGPATSSPSDRITSQKQRLDAHRRTLASYLDRLAIMGCAHAPPEVHHGISEAWAGIARAKAALRSWGIVVHDLPDDG